MQGGTPPRMADSPVYSPNILSDMVELQEELVTSLKKQGQYIKLPHKGEEGPSIAYSTILGKDAIEVPGHLHKDRDFIATHEDYPVENATAEGLEGALRVTNAALCHMFGGKDYTDIHRSYMIGTSSTPIRIDATRRNGGKRVTMYAKKPDTNRIIGKYLYDIISGIPKSRYAFNRTIFLEDNIPGMLLKHHRNEDMLLQDDRYKEGIIRSAVHIDFLGIFSDVTTNRNRIVDSHLRTVLFDFNYLFMRKTLDAPNALLNHYINYIKQPGFMTKNLNDAYFEEMHNIEKRVRDNHKKFFKMVNVAATMKDYSNETLDERVKKWYGARSFEDYIEKYLREYRTLGQMPKPKK